MDKAVKLLPLPDSPTTQVVLPGNMLKLTCLTNKRSAAFLGAMLMFCNCNKGSREFILASKI
jgi:hypothetical protein